MIFYSVPGNLLLVCRRSSTSSLIFSFHLWDTKLARRFLRRLFQPVSRSDLPCFSYDCSDTTELLLLSVYP